MPAKKEKTPNKGGSVSSEKETSSETTKAKKEEEVGKVVHFFGQISVGIVKLTKPIKKGEELHFKGATTDFTQKVESMQVDHKDIDSAKKGDEVGIKLDDKVRDGDTVFRAV